MCFRESDIAYENGRVWVLTDKKNSQYTVFVANSATHCSKGDSAYTLDDDGLSIAKARCDYLARKT